MDKITKAVIPAAGFGTRFLPSAKAVPKEMIPLVDKPVIQYVVEEAAAAGITDILMVVSNGKQTIQEHFTTNCALEQRLEATGKLELLEDLKKITRLADIHYVYQRQLNGLGDAICHARSFVGNEPFAILLGDTVVTSETAPPVGQLVDAYGKTGASVVALEEVPWEKVSRYGVVGGDEIADGLFKVKSFVEKPAAGQAPSNLAIASRYVFTPEIFDFLAVTPRGKSNEIQLTDAMSLMLRDLPMYGLKIDGKRHDIGNKLDFIKATVEFALKCPEFESSLREYLKTIQGLG